MTNTTDAIRDRQKRWLGLPENQAKIGPQLIVGLGMGGSWISDALNRCLAFEAHITAIDPDHVEPVNLCSQNFGLTTAQLEGDPPIHKVHASPDVTAPIPGRYPDNMPDDTQDMRYHTVWSLTDSLDVRKKVAEDILHRNLKTRWLVDIRARWPRFEFYIVDCADREQLKRHLAQDHRFTDEQVPDDAPCSKVGTIAHAWCNVGLPLHHWGLAVSGQDYKAFGEMDLTTMEVCL